MSGNTSLSDKQTKDAYPAAVNILRQLASLKLALVIIVALTAGVLFSYLSAVRTTWALVVPLGLLSINLAAAVATNAAFRRQKGLLVFHLALIAIVLLIATGRLTYLRGTLELTEGVMFDGNLTTSEAGPLHHWHLKDVKFVQDGFQIDYDPGTPNQGFGTDKEPKMGSASSVSDTRGARRAETRNRVHWLDNKQEWHTEVIGDNIPLEILGYHFFTTSNKGFAPLFTWTPTGGAPTTGSIHLPSYPINEYKQYLEWTPPGTNLKLWTQLQFDEVIINPFKPSQFRLPEQHKIVIRQGDNRFELHTGDSVNLPGGVLTYQGLKTWMGYNVDNDWTIGWLFAACIVAMSSLAWHFWKKFAARPWQTDGDKE
jgi:cytochrome c biogenesis protein ResB